MDIQKVTAEYRLSKWMQVIQERQRKRTKHQGFLSKERNKHYMPTFTGSGSYERLHFCNLQNWRSP
jgi:hypothetical protein